MLQRRRIGGGPNNRVGPGGQVRGRRRKVGGRRAELVDLEDLYEDYRAPPIQDIPGRIQGLPHDNSKSLTHLIGIKGSSLSHRWVVRNFCATRTYYLSYFVKFCFTLAFCSFAIIQTPRTNAFTNEAQHLFFPNFEIKIKEFPFSFSLFNFLTLFQCNRLRYKNIHFFNFAFQN